MLIHKILTADQWRALFASGESTGASVDVADGFVHFSTLFQLAETHRRHFSGQTGLMLLTIDAGTLGDALRWEPSRGGDLFPHLYGPLRIADAVHTGPLPLSDDGTVQIDQVPR